MIGCPVLAMGLIMNIIAVLFCICCILLVLVVLIQKGKGGGLSGAFGGGLASNLLGSKTGDFLTWVTITMVGVFLILAVVMAKWYRPPTGGSYIENQGSEQSQPVSADTTAGAPAIPGGEAIPGNTPTPIVPQEPAPEPVMPDTTTTDSNAGG